jgi:hypothetical protein
MTANPRPAKEGRVRHKWPQFSLLTLLLITAGVGFLITTWRAMMAKPGEPLFERPWIIAIAFFALWVG